MDVDDNSWVFDSLICFLNGPVWNAPLQSFIEEKSLIFEPNNKNDDVYRMVHEEFKNLVDLMLGSYMEDICITPEQFETACNNGMHDRLPSHFQENLFEQIWAANDYEMFKRMMIQKNIELQLQALQLIEQKYGATPQLYLPNTTSPKRQEVDGGTSASGSSSPTNITTTEKELMLQVIKQCEPEDVTTDPEEITKVKSYVTEEKLMLENVLQSTDSKSEMYTKPATQVKDEEVKKRQEYLKAQRDKLVALKKQVRKTHLQVEISNEKTKNRPQSAKTAEAVLTGTGEINIAPEILKIRRALAERLRSEVISKTTE